MSRLADCCVCGLYAELVAQDRCWRCYAYLRRHGCDRDDPSQADAIPTTVYLLYGADGPLLYVGISRRFAGRIHQHAADKTWWTQVARAEFEHYGSEQGARAREAELVNKRRPRFNTLLQRPRGEMCVNDLCDNVKPSGKQRCAACEKYLQRNGVWKGSAGRISASPHGAKPAREARCAVSPPNKPNSAASA